MADNRVSASLSAADHAAVLAAINTIREKLPFLIDLTPEQRRDLPKMGDRSQAFVNQALNLATQSSDYLPRSFSVEEMRKDVELAAAMQPIMVALTQLQELVEDTYMALGSEAYSSALTVYRYARSSGEGEALDQLLDEMAQRFSRKPRKTPPADEGTQTT